MNISEASDINLLLDYLLRQPVGSATAALAAAIRLADRAYAVLHVGLDGADVELNWRDLEDLVADEVEALEEEEMNANERESIRTEAAL